MPNLAIFRRSALLTAIVMVVTALAVPLAVQKTSLVLAKPIPEVYLLRRELYQSPVKNRQATDGAVSSVVREYSFPQESWV
jgi:hypothetical protein